MISKREQLEMGYSLYGLPSRARPEEPEHVPKHMKRYDNSWTHCCFAGCTPRGCPGGCCVNDFEHKAHCPLNIVRQMDDAHHDIYVATGLRKHLAPPTDRPLWTGQPHVRYYKYVDREIND